MTGSLALPALEILLRMSPLAALQALLAAAATSELAHLRAAYPAAAAIAAAAATDTTPHWFSHLRHPGATAATAPPLPLAAALLSRIAGLPPAALCAALLVNGALAFALNISSFHTNRVAGALTLTVAGNVKQCLTILLGVVLFDVRVGLVNGMGMVVAVVGGFWFGVVELGGRGRG